MSGFASDLFDSCCLLQTLMQFAISSFFSCSLKQSFGILNPEKARFRAWFCSFQRSILNEENPSLCPLCLMPHYASVWTLPPPSHCNWMMCWFHTELNTTLLYWLLTEPLLDVPCCPSLRCLYVPSLLPSIFLTPPPDPLSVLLTPYGRTWELNPKLFWVKNTIKKFYYHPSLCSGMQSCKVEMKLIFFETIQDQMLHNLALETGLHVFGCCVYSCCVKKLNISCSSLFCPLKPVCLFVIEWNQLYFLCVFAVPQFVCWVI